MKTQFKTHNWLGFPVLARCTSFSGGMEKCTIKSYKYRRTKTLAEKGMSSSKMQQNPLCQNKNTEIPVPCSVKPHDLTSPPNHFSHDKCSSSLACHFFPPIWSGGENQE